MLKAEMTQQQLANRSLFVKRLTKAGWNPRGWEQLFDSGAHLSPEAQAEYQNAAFNLRLNYYIEDGYISLECVGRDDAAVRSFRFYPQKDLALVIDTITGVQDTLSSENYPDFIKTMISICDPVLLETAEGLVQLSL